MKRKRINISQALLKEENESLSISDKKTDRIKISETLLRNWKYSTKSLVENNEAFSQLRGLLAKKPSKTNWSKLIKMIHNIKNKPLVNQADIEYILIHTKDWPNEIQFTPYWIITSLISKEEEIPATIQLFKTVTLKSNENFLEIINNLVNLKQINIYEEPLSEKNKAICQERGIVINEHKIIPTDYPERMGMSEDWIDSNKNLKKKSKLKIIHQIGKAVLKKI